MTICSKSLAVDMAPLAPPGYAYDQPSHASEERRFCH